MAFVRSGIVYLDASAVWYVGRYAQLWSRTANSPNNAYDLFIYTDNVDPSAGGGRYVGRSISWRWSLRRSIPPLPLPR